MKYLIMSCIILSAVVSANEPLPRWLNPGVFQENQTEPHAFHVPYAEIDQALTGRDAECRYYQLLNGDWHFKWVENPDAVPEAFDQTDFDASDWDRIPVPSNWQMQGYGYPKFRNIALSFRAEPPHVPTEFNPVGLYRRTFTVPYSWTDRDVLLRFEGVKSAAWVYVNGEYAGYNEGSFEPAEFDITPFIKPGENQLAVKVLRFCDATFLENQDMWRLSGIFRDVKLSAVPRTRIQDVFAVTDLDKDYRDARLNLAIDLKNTGAEPVSGFQLTVDVLDDTDSILEEPLRKDLTLPGKSLKTLRLSTGVADPRKWSAETPNLYTLLFQLSDAQGRTIEAFSQNLGFREVEIKGDAVLINGVPVKFNGVNSHMHHPDHGQAVPLETLRRDLVLMKQHNINCVRTSHYPPTPEYLNMADKLGVYVMDEVNDEAHSNIQLSKDPAWRAMYCDRARKLVYRDRNHPSVVVWSAGNESGSGENIKAVIETGKDLDSTRPWMYGGNTFYIPFEDITGPRYWVPERLQRLAEGLETPRNDNRPSFMDEYLAATGNGIGGLDEYWDLIYNYSRLTGGAIWDWVSPGVTRAGVDHSGCLSASCRCLCHGTT
ncbi:MAG: glycoside hydrolase family 2 TIM barrel-domain containing protein [candidate division KSB1 bacterium]|nr:glycoside hydrolase family 2 TIM barrel-domain containing protein [candidate division KSB1 bacterium]